MRRFYEEKKKVKGILNLSLTFYCGFISNMLDVSSFISSLEVISVIFVSSVATL